MFIRLISSILINLISIVLIIVRESLRHLTISSIIGRNIIKSKILLINYV